MDQRRFRSLGVAATLAITLAVNANSLIAAFTGEYAVEYVLARYVAGLVIGYVGLRIMETILFKPKKDPDTGDGPGPTKNGNNPGSTTAVPSAASSEEAVN